MTETYELLITTRDGQIVAGEISLTDGKLKSSPKKGHKGLVKEIRNAKTIIGEQRFDPAKDPEGWIKSLPDAYSGSYFRVRKKSGGK